MLVICRSLTSAVSLLVAPSVAVHVECLVRRLASCFSFPCSAYSDLSELHCVIPSDVHVRCGILHLCLLNMCACSDTSCWLHRNHSVFVENLTTTLCTCLFDKSICTFLCLRKINRIQRRDGTMRTSCVTDVSLSTFSLYPCIKNPLEVL